jgi:hypothetical protein
MMFIPGALISWVTFPGTIVHELAHKWACEWRGVQVTDVSYFSLDGSGYVQHHRPRDHRDTILISTAPFAVNSVLAVVCYVLAISTATGVILSDYASVAVFGFAWLGLSIGMHAFPSPGDLGNVWREVRSHWRTSMIAALVIPAVILFRIASLLEFFWFDAIYAAALGVATVLALHITMAEVTPILSGVGI